MNPAIKRLILCILSVCILVVGLTYVKFYQDIQNEKDTSSYLYYDTLPADESKTDPLAYLTKDFQMKEGFTSNLPLVVIQVEEEFPKYKSFENSQEIVYEDVEPWIEGMLSLPSQFSFSFRFFQKKEWHPDL